MIIKKNKKLTKRFESSLFPKFTVYSASLTVYNLESKFSILFNRQLNKIQDMIDNNVFMPDSIMDNLGKIINVSDFDYKNVSNYVLSAIMSHGIEYGIAYQVFKMIYGYTIHYTNTYFPIEGMNDKVSFIKKRFNLKNYSKYKINPFSRLYTKYTVSIEKQNVKTALFAKEKETDKKYIIPISIPTPYILSEIYISKKDNDIIEVSVPNIFEENNEEYLPLLIKIGEDNKDFTDLLIGIIENQNIALTMLLLNPDGSLTFKFEGLNLTNEYFLNRRAGKEEIKSPFGSLVYYKNKLDSMNIEVNDKDQYSLDKCKKLTKNRKKIEVNNLLGLDEDSFQLSIRRAKELIHNAKSIRSNN